MYIYIYLYPLVPFILKYPLVSSNMAGWKLLKLNGGSIRKITDKGMIFFLEIDIISINIVGIRYIDDPI